MIHLASNARKEPAGMNFPIGAVYDATGGAAPSFCSGWSSVIIRARCVARRLLHAQGAENFHGGFWHG